MYEISQYYDREGESVDYQTSNYNLAATSFIKQVPRLSAWNMNWRSIVINLISAGVYL